MKLCAVCISKDPEKWLIDRIPFVNYTDGWKPFPRDRSGERIEYLATRRNAAVEVALKQLPETSHILMIDSYYLNQPNSIDALVSRYKDSEAIQGGATWIPRKRRLWPENAFWDAWTTPEFRELMWSEKLRRLPLMPVKAVGAVYILPVDVWKKRGYGVPSYGCEHNYLCEGSKCFMDFSAEFWRDPFVYPLYRRMRSTVGYFLHGYFLKRNHILTIPDNY